MVRNRRTGKCNVYYYEGEPVDCLDIVEKLNGLLCQLYHYNERLLFCDTFFTICYYQLTSTDRYIIGISTHAIFTALEMAGARD